MSSRHHEQGSRFRRDIPRQPRLSRVNPGTDAPQRSSGMRLAGFALVGVVFLSFFLSTRQEPITFGFDQTEFVALWNEAAADSGHPTLIIEAVRWTDEEAGVFGVAFSDTTSVLGRVETPARQDIEELALVGQPSIDGESFVVAAMDIVIQITEPTLGKADRATVLSELAVLGTLPADPSQRTTAGTTEYRVAADAVNGVIGIGARPAPPG